MASILDTLNTVFTKGLDAATTVAVAKYTASDPTMTVTGANGKRVVAGTGAGGGAAVAGVPVWMIAAGGGALLLVVLLLRKR